MRFSTLEIIFRCDASLRIGSGHVMRCLTLADKLKEQGANCCFISRAHQGHLLDIIIQRGHDVLALPKLNDCIRSNSDDTAHATWLGTDWSIDAQDTEKVLDGYLGDVLADWLVVDHYALDARWERALRKSANRIVVIDDLADRTHDCDLLLDQTFGRIASDYAALTPQGCTLLCGSQYALLRPEFFALRQNSLRRREQPVLKEILITMGGVDKDNVTQDVLSALRHCSLPKDCRLTIVLGQTAPWLTEIQNLAREMPWPTRVLVGVDNMAQLMADSDLAIGAAGSTSWERCSLGLPSIMLVLADNQLEVAKGLEGVGAALVCRPDGDLTTQLRFLLNGFCSDNDAMVEMSVAARQVTNGTGVDAVLAFLGAGLEQD